MKLLILDIETTGTLALGGAIVEIGIARVDFEAQSVEVIFDSVVQEPIRRVEQALFHHIEEKRLLRKELERSWIVRNSTITVNEILSSRTVDEVRTEVQAILDAHQFVCAYNEDFDFSFMRSRGFRLPESAPDPSEVGKRLYDKRDNRGQRRFHKMDALYRMVLGKPEYKEQHRAAQDAFDCGEIILELYKSGEYSI